MSVRNRRQFLEESMIATAAMTVSASQPLLGMVDQGRSAQDRLGVAIVGLRGRGGSHIGAFAGRKDTEVLYVCDVDAQVGEKRRLEVEKRQGRAPRWEADLRRVLEDPRVDVVTIATPNHLHAMQAIWAMQAGKDVYVEKPVSHNLSEGCCLVAAARKYERVCQAGLQCRSNAAMIAAMQFLASGAIGAANTVRGISYTRRSDMGPSGVYPVPPHIDYDLWLGPAPWTPLTRARFHFDWNWQWEYGNGELGHQGAHQLDLARWALGVTALGGSVLSLGVTDGTDARETADEQIVLHDFGRQSIALEIRASVAEGGRCGPAGLIVECEDGYLAIARYDSAAAFDSRGKKIRDFRGSGDHFSNFLKAVRSGRRRDLNADIEQGRISSGLCHLGNISLRLGRQLAPGDVSGRLKSLSRLEPRGDLYERLLVHVGPNGLAAGKAARLGALLEVDPVSETFLNSGEANSMLTRSYRSPYVVPPAHLV